MLGCINEGVCGYLTNSVWALGVLRGFCLLSGGCFIGVETRKGFADLVVFGSVLTVVTSEAPSCIEGDDGKGGSERVRGLVRRAPGSGIGGFPRIPMFGGKSIVVGVRFSPLLRFFFLVLGFFLQEGGAILLLSCSTTEDSCSGIVGVALGELVVRGEKGEEGRGDLAVLVG